MSDNKINVKQLYPTKKQGIKPGGQVRIISDFTPSFYPSDEVVYVDGDINIGYVTSHRLFVSDKEITWGMWIGSEFERWLEFEEVLEYVDRDTRKQLLMEHL